VIRTLIVDDQSMIRVGIRAILESQDDITVVGEAENGRLGVEHCRRLRPDVVLMDVRMPVLDGLAATRAVLGGSTSAGPRPGGGFAVEARLPVRSAGAPGSPR